MNYLSFIFSGFKLPKKTISNFDSNCERFEQHEANDYINSIRLDIEDIANRFPESQFPTTQQVSNSKVDKQELINKLFDFYHQIDPTGYMETKLKTIISSPQYNFQILDDIPNSTTGKNPNGQLDILIKSSSFEKTFLDSAHELAHAMCQRNQNPKPKRIKPSNLENDKNGICGEIESIFMEKLAENFLISQGLMKSSKQNERVKNLLIEPSHSILQTNNILNGIKPPITQSKVDNFFIQCLDTKNPNANAFRCRIDQLANNPDERSLFKLRYIIGELISDKLLESYRTNQNETMSNFVSYIQNNDGIDYQKACIELLGIPMTIKQLTDSYVSNLTPSSPTI